MDEHIAHLGKGTYILILQLDQPADLEIGRLGTFHFPAGFYAYVGSAMGSGGLAARLNHHLHISQRPHWHMDYLRRAAPVRQIWFLENAVRREHEWAKILSNLPDARIIVPRFGASDCRCDSHLFYYPRQPVFSAFQNQTARHFSGDGTVSQIEWKK